MKMNELLKEIETTYNKSFKNSKCVVRYYTSLYNSISINCYVAGCQEEFSSGISQNDMFNIRFTIQTEKGAFAKDITLESEVPENLILEADSKSYTIKPEDKYMAYGNRKLSFRKTKGDSKKVITTLDKFFTNLKIDLVGALENNIIHDSHKQLLISKLG